jgi:hypothetical protein
MWNSMSKQRTCFLNLCAMSAVIVPPLGLRNEAACSTTAPRDASSSTLSAVSWSEQPGRRGYVSEEGE